MDINKAKEYITKLVIDLDDFFEEPVSITLREPTIQEYTGLSRNFSQEGENDIDGFEAIVDLYPKLIIDHGFTNGDKKCSVREVTNVLNSKTEIVTYISEKLTTLLNPKKKTYSTSEK